MIALPGCASKRTAATALPVAKRARTKAKTKKAPKTGPVVDLSAVPLSAVVGLATSKDRAQANAAIAVLRKMGRRGLVALCQRHRCGTTAAFSRARILQAPFKRPGPGAAIRRAIDQVAQQKDAHVSFLYWHTELAEATRVAKKENKPILSLRLLGKLSDDLSCANSRYFRTVLYANAAVSALLRDKFVLHWKSVRPVPVITIDFGDGRKLRRTITGNSIHYVTDSLGRPVEALPGLYGPAAFRRALERVYPLAQSAGKLGRRDYLAATRKYHAGGISRVIAAWTRDLVRLKKTAPLADAAPVYSLATIRAAGARLAELGRLTDKVTWNRIANLHRKDARLDISSRSLVTSKAPSAWRASQIAVTKAFVENPMLRVMRSFERTIALDSVKNEYQRHAKLHRWFMEGNAQHSLAGLNRRVYAHLFLTPRSDPWLGLARPTAYSALDDEGLIPPKPKRRKPVARAPRHQR